jgi:hypothetical protein
MIYMSIYVCNNKSNHTISNNVLQLRVRNCNYTTEYTIQDNKIQYVPSFANVFPSHFSSWIFTIRLRFLSDDVINLALTGSRYFGTGIIAISISRVFNMWHLRQKYPGSSSMILQVIRWCILQSLLSFQWWGRVVDIISMAYYSTCWDTYIQ